jgi:hypothetical protein
MVHRAETIMAKVETTLAGLTTTGDNVFRGQAYAISEDQVPALLVIMGEDVIQEKHTPDSVFSILGVNLDAIVSETTTNIDTQLNKIREEATMALAADITLGLAYVQQIEEIGSEQPEYTGDADRPTARQRTVWAVTYERSRSNPAN